MNKISICYIAQGNYWSAVHSFESIGFAIKEKEVDWIEKDAPKEYIKTIGDIEIELLIADFIFDVRTIDYFNNIATHYMPIEYGVTMAKAYNDLLRLATGDYICIIPSGLFLQGNWLTELIYYYKNIAKSGIASIVYDTKEAELISLLCNDNENLMKVFSPKKNLESSLLFVDRQHFYYVGAIDESVHLIGNEINQFAARCEFIGLFNYCIPSESCFFIGNSEHIKDAVSEENLKTTLNGMRKTRNYYIPL